jgi:hypothetical protein
LANVQMTAASGEPDLDSLSAWRQALTRQARALRTEIQAQQTTLAHVEERLSLVTKLIEIETRAHGADPISNGEAGSTPNQALANEAHDRLGTSDFEGAVEAILSAAGEPLHISSIRESLMAKRIPIPGRGDDANIIVRLRRLDDRFTRTARGTYGLAEWGIPEAPSRKRKRRKATTR